MALHRGAEDPAAGGLGRAGRLAGLALLLLACVAIVLAAGAAARRIAAASLLAQGEARLPLAVAALGAELDKQRTLPLILSQDPLILDVLERPDPALLRQVDEKLKRLREATGAAVIYLLDADGLALAASNAGQPDSFVGNDYRFRRYFLGALQTGGAEQVALGTVSKRPGVYISARVDAGGRTGLGVVVVKVELDGVEADWRNGGQPVYVADRRGIVVATSVPDWRFRTLAPLSAPEAAEIRESLQFGAAPLDRLPLAPDPDIAGLVWADAGQGVQRYAAVETGVPAGLPGWRLHLLVPARDALLFAGSLAQLVAALVLALLVAAGLFLVRRARHRRRQGLAAARAAAELEARVAARTADLNAANARLVEEIAEREKAEARMVALREDLAQANRLATLGQVAAGVAHEINQPLAAIRTFGENAGTFLERGDTAAASGNIRTLVGLTDRIAAITDALRGYGRRSGGRPEPQRVGEILDGALLILRSRLKESGVGLERQDETGGAEILGGRIRLEQVLVNLLRNAVEALEGRPDPRIRLLAAADAREVRIEVSDNGPGIPEDVLAAIFTPFNTSKPTGMGLGLVISKDIVADLGGSLSVDSRPGAGAAFTIRLPRAIP